ncbi:hypothetical protein MNBD_ALPHA07-2043 [hydrothermal vent metagenome]|uniref:Uncharacterized protein n=1 Tax=hydrothermal vent metagenome TaxID=652676 RepID=A0A3B0SJN2_9ZZZZ
MARRLEIQGICNDLLDSFVSRYNDLNGYWALGVFQGFLRANSADELCFDLLDVEQCEIKTVFSQTSNYYQSALQRHLKTRNISSQWVEAGSIKVQRTSSTGLMCRIEIKTDLGRVFASQRHVMARPHDPMFELQSAGKFGPKNQKGE